MTAGRIHRRSSPSSAPRPSKRRVGRRNGLTPCSLTRFSLDAHSHYRRRAEGERQEPSLHRADPAERIQGRRDAQYAACGPQRRRAPS